MLGNVTYIVKANKDKLAEFDTHLEAVGFCLNARHNAEKRPLAIIKSTDRMFAGVTIGSKNEIVFTMPEVRYG